MVRCMSVVGCMFDIDTHIDTGVGSEVGRLFEVVRVLVE